MMQHETNTFSPVPAPLARFGSPEVPTGEDVYRLFKGTGTSQLRGSRLVNCYPDLFIARNKIWLARR